VTYKHHFAGVVTQYTYCLSCH